MLITQSLSELTTYLVYNGKYKFMHLKLKSMKNIIPCDILKIPFNIWCALKVHCSAKRPPVNFPMGCEPCRARLRCTRKAFTAFITLQVFYSYNYYKYLQGFTSCNVLEDLLSWIFVNCLINTRSRTVSRGIFYIFTSLFYTLLWWSTFGCVSQNSWAPARIVTCAPILLLSLIILSPRE